MMRWPIAAAVVLGAALASAIAPLGALAGSRFETTPTPSAEAAASLDFSIVVPKIVYLGPLRGDDDKDAARPFASGKSVRLKVREPYTAITNGGTIAFSAAEQGQIRPPETGDANVRREPPTNRVYVVAIP